MKNNTTFNAPSIICVIASIGGLLYSAWKAKKALEACNKLDIAMDSLEKNWRILDKAISKHTSENTTSEY